MKDYSEPCGISLSGRCQNIKPITYLDIVTTKILLRLVIEHFQSERGVLLIMKSMLVTKFNSIFRFKWLSLCNTLFVCLVWFKYCCLDYIFFVGFWTGRRSRSHFSRLLHDGNPRCRHISLNVITVGGAAIKQSRITWKHFDITGEQVETTSWMNTGARHSFYPPAFYLLRSRTRVKVLEARQTKRSLLDFGCL